MPTARLDNFARESVNVAIRKILERRIYTVPYFLDKCSRDSNIEFYYSLVDPDVLRAASFLNTHNKHAISYAYAWYVEAQPDSRINQLRFRFSGGSPIDFGTVMCPTTSLVHDALVTYALARADIAQENSELRQFLRDVVEASSTAGQLYRALPFLKTFLPLNVLSSLGDAERKSRMPKGVVGDREFYKKAEHLHQTIAVASLLEQPPDSVTGAIPTYETLERRKPQPEQP